MLDIHFIKDNLEEVKINIENRFIKADPDLLVRLLEEKNKTIYELDGKRKKRNDNADEMKKLNDLSKKEHLINEGKILKANISDLEDKLLKIQEKMDIEHKKIPNMAHPDIPRGREEKDNLEVEKWGMIPSFNFKAKDHLEIGKNLDLIDFEAAVNVSGTKFYYLKNEAVILELALVRFALDHLQKNGFSLFSTPDIAKTEILEGIGFNPRGKESNVYNLEDEDTCLIGTAEITLGGYYANTIIDISKLPIRMAGLSHCFRKEAGAAGQFSKGLYRVHQFTKVEMFVCTKIEHSERIHLELLNIEKEIFSLLKIPFRVVETCTGDLGASAFRKWDLEAWMPGRNNGEYGEVTSTSNCTDYQARRLNIKYKDSDGKNKFAHLLNGTAIACSRAMIAILENYQTSEGKINIPEVLIPYCGFSSIPR